MKKLLLPLILLFAYRVQAQKVVSREKVNDHSIHVVGSNFEGVVFTGDDFSEDAAKNSGEFSHITSYKPSRAELNLAEKILYTQIKDMDKEHHYRNGLDIFNHWKLYRHQYVFYKTLDGERYVWINCFLTTDNDLWSRKAKTYLGEELNIPRWYNNLILAFDGGDAYWRVRIDLKAKKIIEFNINGSPV